MKTKLNLYPLKAVNTAFLMLMIFLVASCGTLPKVTSLQPDGWGDDVEQKNKIKQWNIKGRLGIQTEDNGGAFDLFWNQGKDKYTIRLIAPLGQGALTIEGNSESVSVLDSHGLMQYAENPDLLIKQNLGVDLPVTSLRQWLLGLPDTKLSVESLSWNEEGQLHRLQQAGWAIEMSGYKKAEEFLLPHTFVLQRDDRPELLIRLLIRQWSING